LYKNLNKLVPDGLNALITSCVLIFLSISSVYAADERTVSTVSYDHVLSWALGLIVVLCLFFACAWTVKKTGALSINAKTNMKVISGLSLGMREKLVLVQVGEKQLVLGVTPGRIDNLLVLEGNDQLVKDTLEKGAAGDFSKKLKQVLAGSENE
jgi:flagellar protein FliO/FliZ